MFDSRNKRLICETIFDDPKRDFFLRELAEESDVSPSTASRIVKELNQESILDVDNSGIRMSIQAADNEKFKGLKQSYNLWKLSESSLIDNIEEECFPEAIVLFGSYSRGEDTKNSDIDIAIVNGRKFKHKKHNYSFNRELSFHNVNLDEAGKNFIESLANGITMRGHLEI